MAKKPARIGLSRSKKDNNRPQPRVTRACDNCYHKREKCTYTLTETDCDRCKLHGTVCVRNRPARSVGRRRLLPPSRVATCTGPMLPYNLNPFGVLFKDLRPADAIMVNQFSNASNFAALGVAPRVLDQMHREAMRSLFRNFEDVKDGFFSMYEALATAMSIVIPDYNFDANIRRGTVALKRFQQLPCPKDTETFEPWIWLGTSILVHAHCALGANCLSLRRYMLSQIHDLGEHGSEFKVHPVVVCITIQDLFESLLQCRQPVLNVPGGDLMPIDAFFGVAPGLLRLLFELCELRYRIGATMGGAFEDELGCLETAISTWQPNMSPRLSHFTCAMEATHALTQARALQTMMLLFIHRLHFPFKHGNTSMKLMAQNILSDLDLATAMTGKAPLWVTLPFIVAAVEITEPLLREKALNDIAAYIDPVSAKSREKFQKFFEVAWALSDSSPEFNWVKSMDQLPSICITIG